MDNVVIQYQFFQAKAKYPKLLCPTKEDKYWTINGAIDVTDDEGGYWGTYDVQIVFPGDYPANLPVLIETGNKIERNLDWHISSKGICCLSTQAKMHFDLAGEITLLNWLDRFVHPYLANHVYKIKEGRYANEGFSHGIEGIVEGWKKILRLNDEIQIIDYLQLISGKRSLSLNQECFCGTGKKYKRCYLLNRKRHLLNIPISRIEEDIKILTGNNNRFKK